MRLAEFFDRAVNWPSLPGIVTTLIVATVFGVVGAALSFRRPYWIGRTVGLLCFAMVMAMLFVVFEQTASDMWDRHRVVLRYQNPERTRLLSEIALIVLPCATVVVMWAGYLTSRYRLRSQVPRFLKAGRKHFAQKNFDSALREYNQAIHAAPDLAEGYCRRSLVYHEMGKTAEALSDLDRAIECDPAHPSAYLERGKVRTESGDLDGALADFGQLMQIRANDPNSYLQRGVCLVKKGLVDDAVADFHRVLKLTNHSDFAEPAKDYLRRVLEDPGAMQPRFRANGSASLPSTPQPRTEDLTI